MGTQQFGSVQRDDETKPLENALNPTPPKASSKDKPALVTLMRWGRGGWEQKDDPEGKIPVFPLFTSFSSPLPLFQPFLSSSLC